MIIIPAIDLKDGLCVRLIQGDKDKLTSYSNDPVKTAKRWTDAGAELIHIVDLDGAFSGKQKNIESIKNIRNAVNVPIELGGGIRDIETITYLIKLGIDRIIIGTAAITNPDLLKQACNEYPGKIFVSIDAMDGKMAIKGWQEVTQVSAEDAARVSYEAGAAGIVYTDISRDGMLIGVNISAVKLMAEALEIPVIASGGVSSMEDINELLKIEKLYGAITGKAIYSGAIDLRQAIELTKKHK
ncbi:1-(5-phosphoribosyl)-5-[(5-phosphoribosylamino)methylideneamino] imidazole-4-carboxamide isomerase [Candidatus Magnetoovum chiemensis]|nr:1-(5-phosphoribosyl)-5-[(5-phosphoribosylamino)methylideneamino] imidazole-4-carboxamide isomerase [Candidatus Magnetoovum chiemensis]